MPIPFFQQYQIRTQPPPPDLFVPKFESTWHQPWSEPVRFKTPPRRQIALAASGFIAPVLDDDQITTFYESRWHYPWSEPVRFRIVPRLRVALSASGLFAPVLNPETQITRFYESRWHYPWSEPVWPKKGLREQRQQVTAFWPYPMPTPNVALIMQAHSNETSDAASFFIKLPDVSLAMQAFSDEASDVAEFLMTVSDELPTTPDLTSVNVSIEEVDSSVTGISIKGDNV